MDENFSNSNRKISTSLKGLKGEEWENAFSKYISEIKYPPVKDFKKGLEWFNVSKPISFKEDLKGKLVLLDFFTYCCINCMHILPDLKEIEEEFSIEDGLVVIGVHSAKFQNEKVSSNILAAVQRYNIKHPVVNDFEMDMWQECGVYCWPSMVLLGPNANPIILLTGEGNKEQLKLYIRNALKYYKARGEISNHTLPMKSVYHHLPEKKGPLLFPGKITNVLTKNKEEIFAVSDTGNNRIIIFDKTGKILKQIGSSKIGFKDGSFEETQFNGPQGLTFYDENELFIADTENHAIRMAVLQHDTVKTITGTGEQNHDDYTGGKFSMNQSISSPWDVVVYRNEDKLEALVIAMAGTHQIWAYFLNTMQLWKNNKGAVGTCKCIAGSGREENRNNTYAHASAFAQPSGLALCKKKSEIYIADSESSSIRRFSLIDGRVSAVVGGKEDPKNLFAFGDVDGEKCNAKLQHPLGVAMSNDDSHLFVTDTYNHKIKVVDIKTNVITTLTTPPGTFNEPGGLCMSLTEPKLYIADTNNHCIKVAELDSDYKITKVTQLTLSSSENSRKSPKFRGETVKTTPVSLTKEGGQFSVRVSVQFSDGLKLTEDISQNWEVEIPNVSYSCVPKSGNNLKEVEFFVSVPPGPEIADDRVLVVFDIMTCTDSACIPKKFAVEIPMSCSEKKDEEKLVTVNIKQNSIEVV